MKLRPKLKLYISVIIILLVIIIATSYRQYSDNTYTLKYVPEDMSITVDGKQVDGSKKISLKSGYHKVVGVSPPFDDAVKEFHTDDLPSGSSIFLIPKAGSREAQDLLKTDTELALRFEELGGEESSQEQQIMIKKYPFLSSLPYNSDLFRLDYGQINNRPGVVVTLFAILNGPDDYENYQNALRDNKAKAIEYIESRGFKVNENNTKFTPDPDDNSIISKIRSKLPYFSNVKGYMIESKLDEEGNDYLLIHLYAPNAKTDSLDFLNLYNINEKNVRIDFKTEYSQEYDSSAER